MDSQADISVIKISSLSDSCIIDSNNRTNIVGITDGSVQSLGTIQTSLLFGPSHYPIELEFTVVPANFPIPVDGIIGKDFIKYYKCSLDYFTNTFTVRHSSNLFDVPILDNTCHSNYHLIPPRCEVIRYFNLQTDKISDQVVSNQEIFPGVFIATSIVNPKCCFLKLLNTNSRSVEIKKILKLKTEDFSNYKPLSQNSNKNNVSQCNRPDLLDNILKSNIPSHAPESLINLCHKYSDIFHVPGDKHTVNNFYQQKLNLSDSTPVYIKNYRSPHALKEEISNQVTEMLTQKIIEPSTSSYNSPIILVPKKSTNGLKKYRLCVDFRQLNKRLIPDKFPLPRIDDVLDNLGRAKYFSTLDLFSGFWQVPLEEQSKNLTSFSTTEGSFRFNVLPFGLNVAPNSFARMMSIAFSGLDPATAFLYLDDIIVVGASVEHHLKNLEKVFIICREKNLKLNPQKCQFLKSEVTFLGHKCTDKGILPDNSKFQTIADYPTPTDKDAVKRFVCFVNYYRNFIDNFASIAAPLNHLLKKKSQFIWSTECVNSFKHLKQVLQEPPILQYPDFSKPFIVTVDASKKGIGAILSQQSDDAIDLPVCFASKAFNPGESNKAAIEQELLAIDFGIKHFRPYIYGTKFVVKSDHKPLQYLFTMKDPTAKLARIRMELADYDFEIEHIKGVDNVAADALSRIHIQEFVKMGEESKRIRAMTTRSMSNNIPLNTSSGCYQVLNNLEIRKRPLITFSANNLGDAKYEFWISLKSRRGTRKTSAAYDTSLVSSNLILKSLFTQLETLTGKLNITSVRVDHSDEIFSFVSHKCFLEIANETLSVLSVALMRPVQIIESADESQKLIEHFHTHPLEGGHAGQKRLYAKIRSSYKWKNMTRDIAKYIKNCRNCSINKPKIKTKEPMVLTNTPSSAFHTIIVDTIGPFPSTTNQAKYAVTIICDLSKFLIIVPIPNKEAKTIARVLLENCFLTFGPVKVIRTDMGTEYMNSVVSALTDLLKIKHHHSTAYHHESLGTVERSHKTLNEYLRTYTNNNPRDWYTFVKYFAFCYNTTPNTSINMLTPFELVYGKKAHHIYHNNSSETTSSNTQEVDINDYVVNLKSILARAHAQTVEFISKNKETYKNYYDRTAKPININVGDNVLLVKEIRSKLDPLYNDKYLVIKVEGVNVTIKNLQNNKTQIVHKNRLNK